MESIGCLSGTIYLKMSSLEIPYQTDGNISGSYLKGRFSNILQNGWNEMMGWVRLTHIHTSPHQ